MSFYKNKENVKALFGDQAFRSLDKVINTCCNTTSNLIDLPCCPEQIYTISIDSVDCTSSPGNPQLHIKTVQNRSIGVPSLVQSLVYNISSVIDITTQVAIFGAIGSSGIIITDPLSPNQGIISLIVIDNYGNYSNILTVDTDTICQ